MEWLPEEYDGLRVIRIKPREVFKPDIMLYNSVDLMTMKNNLIETNLLLYFSGMLLWYSPIVLRAQCEMNLSNWPYDEQNCYFKFGSWTHDGLSINLTGRNVIFIYLLNVIFKYYKMNILFIISKYKTNF